MYEVGRISVKTIPFSFSKYCRVPWYGVGRISVEVRPHYTSIDVLFALIWLLLLPRKWKGDKGSIGSRWKGGEGGGGGARLLQLFTHFSCDPFPITNWRAYTIHYNTLLYYIQNTIHNNTIYRIQNNNLLYTEYTTIRYYMQNTIHYYKQNTKKYYTVYIQSSFILKIQYNKILYNEYNTVQV